MPDIKIEVDKFLEEFKSSPEIEKLRHAIAIAIGDRKTMDLNSLKKAKELLEKWFKNKLYSLGRVIENFETISSKQDYDFSLGLGFSVDAKKSEINIARYLLHLLLVIESKDRQINYLNQEVSGAKNTYLDMENEISNLIKDKKIPDEIKEKFTKFYWLFTEDDDNESED